jgi:choline dehydrogenase-like flavoprotein
MFIDARKDDRREFSCDICIVGAGAAGITLARALSKQDIRICLLESGGFEPDPATQSLYAGAITGVPYYPLEAARLRYFGGTTGHWGGACWPLEENEFEQRDWVPYSGWPFSRKELDPYYAQAQKVCEVGPFNYDAAYWSEEGDQPPLPLVDSRLATKIYQNSAPPTRFGSRYRDDIDKADNISAVLYANVTHIERDDLNQSIRRVTATTLEGKSFPVTARFFVIAAGGMENPRLLLLNDIGNQNDLVGRFFMEHIGLPKSSLLIPMHINTLFYKRTAINGTDIRAGLSLNTDVLEKERILNTWLGFKLDPTPASRLADAWDAVKTPLRHGELPDDFSRHVKSVLRSMRQLYGDLQEKDDHPDEFVTIPVGQQSEQSPNPLSRVKLGDELDELGLRKIVFDWRLTELDYHSIRRTQEILAAEIGKSDLGRMQILNPEDDHVWDNPKRISESAYPSGAFHHMGTTRMHRDPKQGVVDADCRVHGTKNLYIAGSSVFPTCGYENPTLTIVAMAFRLAKHLHEPLSRRTV